MARKRKIDGFNPLGVGKQDQEVVAPKTSEKIFRISSKMRSWEPKTTTQVIDKGYVILSSLKDEKRIERWNGETISRMKARQKM